MTTSIAKKAILLLVLLALATASQSSFAVQTSNADTPTDEALKAACPNPLFEVQCQIGDQALNGDWEIGIVDGPNVANGSDVLAAQANLVWPKRAPEIAWHLTYDPSTGKVQWTVGTTTLASFETANTSITDLYIQTAADNSKTSIAARHLRYKDTDLDDVASWAIGPDGIDILHIYGISGALDLTGTTAMLWNDILPTGSNLAFQIRASGEPIVPEPATMALVGLGLASVGFLRRTKRRS